MFAESVWDDTLRLGLESLDCQHQTIFATVARLGQAIRQARAELTGTLLTDLLAMLQEHFAYEEGLGACSAEHRQTHRQVLDCIEATVGLVKAGEEPCEAELHTALCVTLVKDLIHHDAELVGNLLKAGHLRNRG